MVIFNTWLSTSESLETERVRKVQQHIIGNELHDKQQLNLSEVEHRIKCVCKSLLHMWRKCGNSKTRLITKYAEYLNTDEEFESSLPSLSETNMPSGSGVRGRPRKSFSESSDRTKKRRIAELREIDESLSESLRENSKNFIVPSININECLSLFTEAKLTKHQYLLIKEFINIKLSAKVLPTYQDLLSAKKKCYPADVIVTDNLAEVKIQSLLDHTASRIIEYSESRDPTDLGNINNLRLIGKWGFDGSTGHSEYKQIFVDSDTIDASLLVTSYVPLKLVDMVTEDIVWKNPRPSSTRYCRPIRFQFKKETSTISKEEETYVKNQINNLQPTNIIVAGKSISIKHELQLTMVDGKVCNALTDTASVSCFLCGATPKQMNNIDACLKKPVIDESRFQFGLSTLHAWIRFFEFFLHVSYRLGVKKWHMRTEEEKKSFSERKKYIQMQFREKLGLIVDQPRSGGSGTSNDGNTARRFFSNSEISADIIGIDKTIIDRCRIILITLASGHKINTSKFHSFSVETARQIVAAFPWYNLSATVHKILIHGASVIDYALLPIGDLSEEAAEAKNKDIKNFRLNHTRKISRIASNTDLLNRLLLSSDPLITGLRKLPKKKKASLPQEVLDLICLS